MYQINYSSKFKRDIKKIKKQSARKFDLLLDIVLTLEKGGIVQIPKKTILIHYQEIIRDTSNYTYYPTYCLFGKKTKSEKSYIWLEPEAIQNYFELTEILKIGLYKFLIND